MSQALFSERMTYFEKTGKVISLQNAVEKLREGNLPSNSIVITVDDGWYSSIRDIHPVVARHNLPYTLYVTTYYVQKETPVFNILVDYLFWKTTAKTLNPANICDKVGTDEIDLTNKVSREKYQQSLQSYGDKLPQEKRLIIASKLAEELEIDIQPILSNRVFSLLNEDEVKNLHQMGADIQLHTHRHTFPKNNIERAQSELLENKQIIEQWLESERKHFCYPSGNYDRAYVKMLQESGIESATTCVNGLNSQDNNPLFLKRFLDGEHIHLIVLEAEYSGLLDFVRRFIRR